MAAADKKPDGSTDAACLALRIATVALSVASAALMASASQRSCPAGGCSPAASQQQQVSYSDYSSLKYSLVASIISAVVQGVAACLKARGGKDGESKSKAITAVYELVDTASQVLLYSSSALSFSVDDFGTCGHRVAGICDSSVEFCQRTRISGAVSMAAAVCLAASKYLKDVPISTWFKSGGEKKKKKPGHGPHGHCHH